ncbi:hypothetical protein JW721_03770 [Candidatus Micrarchaeota archaeon]|nr:hypothetical protein [Candidatus Micrarchaeota archaeon]
MAGKLKDRPQDENKATAVPVKLESEGALGQTPEPSVPVKVENEDIENLVRARVNSVLSENPGMRWESAVRMATVECKIKLAQIKNLQVTDKFSEAEKSSQMEHLTKMIDALNSVPEFAHTKSPVPKKASLGHHFEYVTFADPSLLEQDIATAERLRISRQPFVGVQSPDALGRFISKPIEWRYPRFGNFQLDIVESKPDKTHFRIGFPGGEKDVAFSVPLEQVDVLAFNSTKDTPFRVTGCVLRGKDTLFIALETPSGIVVKSLVIDHVRNGARSIGFGVTKKEGTLLVTISPKKLYEGNFVYRLSFGPNGASTEYYRYTKDVPSDTRVKEVGSGGKREFGLFRQEFDCLSELSQFQISDLAKTLDLAGYQYADAMSIMDSIVEEGRASYTIARAGGDNPMNARNVAREAQTKLLISVYNSLEPSYQKRFESEAMLFLRQNEIAARITRLDETYSALLGLDTLYLSSEEDQREAVSKYNLMAPHEADEFFSRFSGFGTK